MFWRIMGALSLANKVIDVFTREKKPNATEDDSEHLHTSWDQVDELTAMINKKYPNGANLVCVYKGSMAIGAAVCNSSDKHTLSVIDYQRLEGNPDTTPTVPINKIEFGLPIVLIEDILDTGLTIEKILETYGSIEEVFVLVSNSPIDKILNKPVSYIEHNKHGKWVTFPWDK